MIGVFYACKKESETTAKSTTATNNANHTSGQRFEGTKTYYSKNHVTGDTVYKMVVTGSAGNMTIDRSIYPTNRPDTFRVLSFIDPSLNYTRVPMQGDTTKVDSIIVAGPSVGQTYYYIPFQPGQPIIGPLNNQNGDGGLVYDCAPMGPCVAQDGCGLNNNPILEGSYCCCCEDCWVTIKLPPDFPGKSKLFPRAGSVLIEASSINVRH